MAITDANLVLGRIIPDFFPKIFGTNEDEPLDWQATLKAFEQLTNEVSVVDKQNFKLFIEFVIWRLMSSHNHQTLQRA